MKKNNLEKILNVLENMENKIVVDQTIGDKARKCIERMLEIK